MCARARAHVRVVGGGVCVYVCVCVCVCVRACVRACVRGVCVSAYALIILSADKIVHFTYTFIIIIYQRSFSHRGVPRSSALEHNSPHSVFSATV